jgi:hypothetical protein
MVTSSPARRIAALALGASVLVLSACSGRADSAPASPAATEAASPATTPTHAGPVVPFDGDCSAMMTDGEATSLVGSAMTLSPEHLTSVTPDMNSSLRLIGSISCEWQGDGTYLQAAVFPTSETSPKAMKDATTACEPSYPICWTSRTVGASWIYAEGSTVETAKSALDLVAGRLAGKPDPTPAPKRESWWTLPACDRLASAVAAALGDHGLQSGFPGDSVPSGPVWETAEAAGAVGWCAWYSQTGTDTTIIELNLQPGAGRPSADLLAAAKATPRTVPGSDVAWDLARDADSEPLLTVSGENRLTVTGAGRGADRIAEVASAVIAQVNAG